jgi:hypothetical protein
MYSVPAREETYGILKELLEPGSKKTGRREEVVLASKIAGPNPNFTYMREKNDFAGKYKIRLDNSYSDFKRITLICINCIGQSENQFFWTKIKVQEDGKIISMLFWTL